jgi:hypothetical protein
MNDQKNNWHRKVKDSKKIFSCKSSTDKSIVRVGPLHHTSRPRNEMIKAKEGSGNRAIAHIALLSRKLEKRTQWVKAKKWSRVARALFLWDREMELQK